MPTGTVRADLDSAAAHLDELGVVHEPIKEIGHGYILEFRDPDHIALELSFAEVTQRVMPATLSNPGRRRTRPTHINTPK